MSHLLFDGDELNLSLYDTSGKLVGSWPVSNFGGPNSDFGMNKKEAFITWIPMGSTGLRGGLKAFPTATQTQSWILRTELTVALGSLG